MHFCCCVWRSLLWEEYKQNINNWWDSIQCLIYTVSVLFSMHLMYINKTSSSNYGLIYKLFKKNTTQIYYLDIAFGPTIRMLKKLVGILTLQTSFSTRKPINFLWFTDVNVKFTDLTDARLPCTLWTFYCSIRKCISY